MTDVVSQHPVRRLYGDDNLAVFRIPRVADTAIEPASVDLIYLDPPFNSKAVYNLPFEAVGRDVRAVAAFHDAWTWGTQEENQLARFDEVAHLDPTSGVFARIVRLARQVQGDDLAAYLVNMSVRLRHLHGFLKPTGSLYLHCDPTASHYLKMLMDAVFGADNFQNEIIWAYGLGGSSWKRYSKKHDVILFYTKTDKYYFDKPLVPATSNRMKGQLKGATDVWEIPTINNMAKERLWIPHPETPKAPRTDRQSLFEAWRSSPRPVLWVRYDTPRCRETRPLVDRY